MSMIVLGLIVNTSSFSDLAFADKPDKESAKVAAKESKESAKVAAKESKESAKVAAKEAKNEIKEFNGGTLLTTSSTTTICHIPPGNPGNNHTITIGNSAVSAHIGHGDEPVSCELVNWEEGGSSTNEQELKNTETDENPIDQLTKQIADLQKRLQKLFGI
ncbi:MAG: hypothetical protein GQ471_02335 [Nitrosopumilus sp.]|nr:hypothetical protein [Nitrosopumilus sp.]